MKEGRKKGRKEERNEEGNDEEQTILRKRRTTNTLMSRIRRQITKMANKQIA